jgi:hypothetical protein
LLPKCHRSFILHYVINAAAEDCWEEDDGDGGARDWDWDLKSVYVVRISTK